MVKIQRRTSKKPYLKSKNIYNYEREQVAIIKKYHSTSKPFRGQDLEEEVWVQNGSLIIKLTPKNPPRLERKIALARLRLVSGN